uniref:Uncharacterized protein n=1 Tax=Tanacetum cinerariifolium TaxID=118510 RepID=A0A6L2JVB7_TANCI|nr:hypothetical protein [Tanacetum cinerariifolium]
MLDIRMGLVLFQKLKISIGIEMLLQHRLRVMVMVSMTAQEEEAGIQSTQEEFEFMVAADAYEETERVKANCILENNLQQASTSAKFVRDFKSLAKEADESIAKHKALELEIERLLREVVSQDIMSVVQNNSVVDTSNLQTELERTKNDLKIISLKRRMTMLNFGMIAINLGKPPSSFIPKLYVVTPLPKSTVFPKVDETYSLSKPVTSNSVPTPIKSKVVKIDNMISPRLFRNNPSKTSRVDNVVPNKPVKASVRTKPITVSQPHVITKNDVKSKTNCFSPTNVKSTTRSRRPLPRNNPNNDKAPFKSKSSQLSNNLEKIKENHKNLHRYDSHDIDDRVRKSIRSFVRRITQMKVVSKTSAVTTADAFDKRQQQQDSTLSTSTLATTITADGNFKL